MLFALRDIGIIIGYQQKHARYSASAADVALVSVLCGLMQMKGICSTEGF